MDLFSITITGFRRFKKTSSLRTVGKVLAVLGPNEAGKSSLLRAISYLDNNDPLPVGATTRGSDPNKLKIVGKFLLDESDLSSAKLTGPRWFVIEKSIDGSRTWNFEPAAPRKNLAHREKLAASFGLLDNNLLEEALTSEDGLASELTELIAELKSAPAASSSDLRARLSAAYTRCRGVFGNKNGGKIGEFLSDFDSAISREGESSPGRYAADILWKKIPKFLFFDESARQLNNAYSMSEIRSNIPPAVANLAKIAELDFEQLFAAIDSGNSGGLTTTRLSP